MPYRLLGDLTGRLVVDGDDQEPTVVAKVSIGIEPVPQPAYIGEPRPVEAEYLPIDSEPAKHLQVRFGHRS